MMKLSNLVFLGLICTSSVCAVDYPNVMIFRGLDGEFSESSKESIKALRQIAQEKGRVHVWVMLDLARPRHESTRSDVVKQHNASKKKTVIAELARLSNGISPQRPHKGGDLNRWTQHLDFQYREEDVADEAEAEDLLQYGAEELDVGSVAGR